MMKATCQWSDRNTTSFRWTRHELITPPSAHKELSRAAVKGIGEMRCSPLFSVQTVEGVNVYVYTSVDFVDSEPKTFAVAFGWYGPIDWANTEAAVWIEAANGALLGEKAFVHNQRKFEFPMSEVRAFLSTASPPFTVCCDLRPYTNLFDLDAPVGRQPLIGPVAEHPTKRFKLLVPCLGLAKECENWESNAIKVSEEQKFKTRMTSKQAADGEFSIKLEMINAGTADKETFWHVRRWLENKFGEKSYVWESVVKFFDGVLWTPFEWQGSRDSLLRFSAASDVFFGFELTRFEKQPAIVEWQPEIVQPAAMQQNGVNEENEEVADELNTSDYLVPGMNAGGDHGEQLAATPRRAPSMSSAATSFTNLTLLDHE